MFSTRGTGPSSLVPVYDIFGLVVLSAENVLRNCFATPTVVVSLVTAMLGNWYLPLAVLQCCIHLQGFFNLLSSPIEWCYDFMHLSSLVGVCELV